MKAGKGIRNKKRHAMHVKNLCKFPAGGWRNRRGEWTPSGEKKGKKLTGSKKKRDGDGGGLFLPTTGSNPSLVSGPGPGWRVAHKWISSKEAKLKKA